MRKPALFRLSRSFVAVFFALFASPLLAQDKVVVAGQDGVAAPKRTKTVQPVYPPEALSQGIRGIVIIELLIDSHGKVVSADIIRSVPGLDEAALSAVRKWEYDTTKVDGQPVSVRLTVPITFALKVPDVTRGPGIPELRQGVAVAYPQGQNETASVAAEVVLAPDGRIATSEVLKGTEPFTTALLAALRTWRFAPQSDDVVLSFRVEADFAAARDGATPRVEVNLTGLRRSEAVPSMDAPASPPVAAEAAAVGSERPGEAPAPTPPPAPATATPAPAAPVPLPTPEAPSITAPSTTPPKTLVPVPPVSSTPPPSSPPASAASPATSSPPPAASRPPAVPAPPPVEVVSAPTPPGSPAPTPPAPVEPGVSAIKDVTLSIGVPDLVRGRRPVPAPVARMAGVTGAVEVRFTVDAAGSTSVQEVTGPDPLKAGASHTVASWVFRRVSADRLYLVAAFDYASETAKAAIQPQPQP